MEAVCVLFQSDNHQVIEFFVFIWNRIWYVGFVQ